MFDIGMWELLVVGIVALIVVGPQDLPKMFRTLGQITGRLRGMAREFQTTMNAAANETGLSDIQKDLRKATDFSKDLRNMSNPVSAAKSALKDAATSGLDGIDGGEEDGASAEQTPEPWKPAKGATRPKTVAPAPAADTTPAADSESTLEPVQTPRSGTSDT